MKNAFLVLYHSTDCEWNKKWTERFLKHYDELEIADLFSFYFYRNFNKKHGQCINSMEYIEELKKGEYSTLINELMNDFTKWENKN